MQDSINKHIEDGDAFDVFFNKIECEKNKGQINALIVLQGNKAVDVFEKILNNNYASYLKQFEAICKDIEEIDKKQLIAGIEKTKSIDQSFKNKIIGTIQNNAALLLSESYGQAQTFFLPTPGLGECHCCKQTGRVYRKAFSDQLVDEMSEYFSKSKCLTIASIGAGSCFHELEIHTLATKAGINVGSWILVDLAFKKNAVTYFTTLANWVNPSTTVQAVKESAHQYFKQMDPSAPPDVVLFIDVFHNIKNAAILSFFETMKSKCLFACLDPTLIESPFAFYKKT
jgi:hypothetical protein